MTPGDLLWSQSPYPNEAPSIPGWLKVALTAGAAWLLYEVLSNSAGNNRAQRDTFRYQLFDGPCKVQDGITNDPARRCAEHLDAGKKFTSMRVVGPAVTRSSALAWERASIESYRERNGRRARYNKI